MSGFVVDYLEEQNRAPAGANYRRRTREDLEAISLKPSNRPLVPYIVDEAAVLAAQKAKTEAKLDHLLDGSYARFKRDQAKLDRWRIARFRPTLNNKFDRIRWELHYLLLKWGVII
jgi:hypothetical protein